jgi:hypothetical protein
MRSFLVGLVIVFALLGAEISEAGLVQINGQDYQTAENPTTVSHGFRDDAFSSPVIFSNDTRYVRVTATSINGGVGFPNFISGAFFTNILGYRENAELQFFKVGFAPKRASQLMVYNMSTSSPLAPNGNPIGQLNSSFNILHDFVIDTNLLAGPLDSYSLRLTVGEDYYNISEADNFGANSYRLDALVAVPEPSALLLVGSVSMGLAVRRRRI